MVAVDKLLNDALNGGHAVSSRCGDIAHQDTLVISYSFLELAQFFETPE